jgi:hypothetical protein
MGTVRENFDLSKVVEYTVEAGRPDCTDAEKLAVIKEYGATRISINPQTFSDEVLAGIGRRHSAQDILDCYADARRAGHEDINMDLIAGLPGDTVAGFEHSLRQAIALDPENITVHTPIDAAKACKIDAADIINIKLMKCGGLYPAEKINAIAEANHVQCMVGCMLETKVAIAAGVSLVAAKQNITEADCDSFMYAVDPEMGMPGGFAVNGGVYTLSDKPGLGIDIDF